jgi:hypothetical protein
MKNNIAYYLYYLLVPLSVANGEAFLLRQKYKKSIFSES